MESEKGAYIAAFITQRPATSSDSACNTQSYAIRNTQYSTYLLIIHHSSFTSSSLSQITFQ
eukprot:scaffold394_cov161-Chaetoceros_neogracile.AAC.4